MNINCRRVKNLSYIVIDNFFSASELKEVLVEVQELKRFSLGPEQTGTASKDNAFIKTGIGVFLDDL